MNDSGSQLSFLYDRRESLDELLGHLPGAGGHIRAGGLVGSSPAWLTASLAIESEAPLLAIVKDQNALYEFVDDLNLFVREALGRKEVPILPFPHVETLPYEVRPPEMSVEIERAEVFLRLLAPGGEPIHYSKSRSSAPPNNEPLIIVAPVRSLMKRLPPAWLVQDVLWRLEVGKKIDRERLLEWIEQEGYERRDLVAIPGHYSVRGGILDIFAYTHEVPIRIEFFGDEIDSIRLFDPLTQRSVKEKKSIQLVPMGRENLALQAWKSGQKLDPFFTYLPENTTVVICEEEQVENESERVMELVEKMFDQQESDDSSSQQERIPPEDLYGDFPQVLEEIREFPLVGLSAFRLSAESNLTESDVFDFSFRAMEFEGADYKARLGNLVSRLNDGLTAAICCDNEGQKERLEELLRTDKALGGDSSQFPEILVGGLHHGFSCPDKSWALLTDREIFMRYKKIRTPRHAGLGVPVRSVLELHPNDFVVHEEYGIAQFMRLSRLEAGGEEGEFLELRFHGDAKLYVPVENVHLIGRYIGGTDQPPRLSKLGGKSWDTTKKRAQKAIEEMATELLELYAERKIAKGTVFERDTTWQQEFEASFLYNETPDQIRSIHEVKEDMESPKTMDRLLCGDVGFGKTEVALRAAFKAVMNGKQVAVLVPTTILAQQHYRTFRERVAEYPLEIRDLSRFRSRLEQQGTVRELAGGNVDIVIGTHRLLSADVKFKNLGLLIIDEEQRFGVKQKERLKQLRSSVDVLTLTATPIPRTLYMSLSGLRDMSQLSVPPEDRLPVLTYVTEFKPAMIEAAILREMARGGQVFFLHNRVKSIGAMANFVSRLVPDARIAVGHGQMPEKQLERLMIDFIDGQYDVLICTTIIESGVDIPNVNTILINRADAFGLADLYQLRGRVGRDRHQAHCYLLVPSKKSISAQARERLLALQEFWQLGEGLNIAIRDMEIRGTGNLLGRQQHGHIAAIGFDLYNKMLRETVSSMRGKKKMDAPEAILDAADRGEIPPTYVESARQRLALYKRLAGLRTQKELDDFRDEIRDLYGPLPREAERLLALRALRRIAGKAGIEYMNLGKDRARLRLSDSAVKDFDPRVIMELSRESKHRIEMSTADGLSLVIHLEGTQEKMPKELRSLILSLAEKHADG